MSRLQSVSKAVIPAAGIGTRLAPLTKYVPKELLPVGGKPIIQYMIEAYMASGISEFCIVTSPHKPQLKAFLTGNWKPPYLPFRRDARFFEKLKGCHTAFLVQNEPKGVADAVALAKGFVGDEPFACIMPDCLLFSQKPFARQLIEAFRKFPQNMIGTVHITGNDVKRYGNVGLLGVKHLQKPCFTITSISDKTVKPLSAKPGEIVHKGFGGGIYLPEYFDLVEAIRPKVKGEVDDVPIHHILVEEGRLLGVLLEGTAFDAGHPLGYRTAVRFVGRRRA